MSKRDGLMAFHGPDFPDLAYRSSQVLAYLIEFKEG